MEEEFRDKETGRFRKNAPSPNPNGAPKGPRKGMTTKQRAEALAKGSKRAMDKVLELIDDENSNIALKAALSVLGEDYKFRQLLMDEVAHSLKMKRLRKEIRELDDGDEKIEESSAPVISLKVSN